jgi:hypothetical protein
LIITTRAVWIFGGRHSTPTNTTARGAEPFKAGTSWAKRGAVATTEDDGFTPRVERKRKSHKSRAGKEDATCYSKNLDLRKRVSGRLLNERTMVTWRP